MSTILDSLAGGDRKFVGRAREVAGLVVENASLLDDLIAGIWHDDAIVRARSAVALKWVALHLPDILQPHKRKLIDDMSQIDQWEVREQFCILLPHLQLTSDDISKTVSIFKDYLGYYSSIVRTCAMQALVDLCEFEPARRLEVAPLIEELSETGTAAMRARGRKLLKHLADTKRT